MAQNNNLGEMINQHLTTVLLIAAAFIIGMLTTEVRYLKKAPAGATAPTNIQGAAPEPATPDLVEWTADQVKNVRPVSDADHVRGPKNAKITLIEYADFECIFCQRYLATLDQLKKDYPDEIRFVWRQFPLSLHPFAQKAAEASECVAKLAGNDAFWKFHDFYYSRTKADGRGFPQEKLADLAVESGVKAGDKAKFQQCLDSGEMAKKTADEEAEGGSYGIQGTPGTIFITSDGRGGFINGAQPIGTVKPFLEKYL